MSHPPLTALVQQLRTLVDPQAGEPSDRQLLREFAEQRSEDSFAALVHRHESLVRGVCWRMLRNQQDAEDAFQATFLVLARKAASIKRGEALAGWLYAVAQRTAMKARQLSERRQDREQRAASRSAEQPLQEAALRELQTILDEEVGRLPANERAPFVLCCLEGRSREEAAQQLGWKEGTVSGRLARARTRLQGRLRRRGVALPAALCALAAAPPVNAAGAAPLIDATVKAATAFAARHALIPRTISAHVATLTNAVLKGIIMSKVKSATVVLLLVSVLTVAAFFGFQTLPAHEAINPPQVREPTPSKKQASPVAAASKAPATGSPAPAVAQPKQDNLAEAGLAPSGTLAWSADGKTILTAGTAWKDTTALLRGKKIAAPKSTLRVWDGRSGKLLKAIDAADLKNPDIEAPLLKDTLGTALMSITILAEDIILTTARRWTRQGTVDEIRLWDSRDWSVIWEPAISGQHRPWIDKVNPKIAEPALHDRLRLEREHPVATAFLARGTQIAVATIDDHPGAARSSVLWLIDGTSGKLRERIDEKHVEVTSLAMSGKWLASGHVDHKIRLWNPDGKPGRILAGATGHKGALTALTFSSDGKYLASAGADKMLKLWNPESGSLIRNFQFSGDRLSAFAFDPEWKSAALAGSKAKDGKMIGLIEFRSALNGELIRSIEEGTGPVEALSYSANGETLATVSGVGMLRLMDLRKSK